MFHFKQNRIEDPSVVARNEITSELSHRMITYYTEVQGYQELNICCQPGHVT